jgi:uncharacterized protein DUF4333
MNNPPPPDSEPGTRWLTRRPNPDNQTRPIRPRPTPPRSYPPPAPGRPPIPGHGPPKTDIPWYLQRPARPPASIPEAAVAQLDSEGRRRGTEIAKHPERSLWLVVGIGVVVLLIAASVLFSKISALGVTGGKSLDVAKVQAGVLQTLADPSSGYGANTVTEVSCNNGRNPSATKGTTFTCDAVVNGAPRHVTVVVSDDNGTYEVDGPR